MKEQLPSRRQNFTRKRCLDETSFLKGNAPRTSRRNLKRYCRMTIWEAAFNVAVGT